MREFIHTMFNVAVLVENAPEKNTQNLQGLDCTVKIICLDLDRELKSACLWYHARDS